MKRIPAIVVCIAVLLGLMGWVDTIATASAETISVDPGAEIAKVDPGAEIAKAVEGVVKAMDDIDPPDDDTAAMALMIPILGILGVFFAPMVVVIVIVWLAYRHRQSKEQRNHETIRQMIEKGIEIPPNISFGEAPETSSPLNRGLKFMGIGVGLSIFFLVMGLTNLAGIGAIPLFIGLAYVLIWHLEKNKTETGKPG
jgi:hypothetical protein